MASQGPTERVTIERTPALSGQGSDYSTPVGCGSGRADGFITSDRYDRRSMGNATPSRTALITGGAGFIGSHLSELLLAQGWEVFVLDDLSTGAEKNVAHLREHPAFHLVVDSVLKSSVVNELVHRSDVVFHLAAAVGVRLIVEEPVHTLVTNIQGTEEVLDHCHRFGKRVLIASTS